MTGRWLAVGTAEFAMNWLIQSTLLLALGLAAGRRLRRAGPALQSAVYRTSLVAVLISPVVSALLVAAGLDGLSIRLPVGMAIGSDVVGTGDHEAKPSHVGAGMRPGDLSGEQGRPSRIGATTAPGMMPSGEMPDPSDEPIAPAVRPAPVAAVDPAPGRAYPRQAWTLAVPGLLAWAFGSAVLAVRLRVGHRRMARLRAAAVPAGPAASALCADLARRMGLSPPPILRTPLLSSPCLSGIRRPAILLPDDVRENLSETLVHELAHLARRDVAWNLLRQASVAALWIQPLLWLLSRRLEIAAEEVCDDVVVQHGADRARYAGHLLDLAERMVPVGVAGVGMIAPRSLLARRVVRILDPARVLSTRAGSRAVAATLAAGLTGTLLAGLLGVGEAAPRAEDPDQRQDLSIDASASGDVPARVGSTGTEKDAPPTPVPARTDVPINGRIVDLEGRPFAGVAVHVTEVSRPKAGDLTPWLEAVRGGEPPWVAYRHLDSAEVPPGAGREATTDELGEFRLKGLGGERVVNLTIRGETVASTGLTVVTRPIGPVAARGFSSRHGPGTQTVYGADFTLTARVGRPVEGVVRDAKTGEPLPGVGVRSYRFAGANLIGMMDLRTTTNEQGRFRLVGLPKGQGNVVIAVPDDDQPYLMHESEVPDPPGVAPVRMEIGLNRGTWIEGKVTDRATGGPVAGAWLHYLPFRENTFAQAVPEFDEGGYTDGSGYQDRYRTKADGTFRLVGLPGRAIVGVIAYGKPYLQGAGSEAIRGMSRNGHFETWSNPIVPGRYWPTSMREIEPVEEAESVRVDFALEAGAAVRLRVVGPRGEPVRGVTADGRTGRGDRDNQARPEAEFAVEHLAPDEDRMVLIRHAEEDLGKVIHVREGADRDGPLVVTLEPAAEILGRVVSDEGAPVEGATIRPDPKPSGDFHLSLPHVVTDQDGRFRIADVPTGCDYSLVVESGAMLKSRRVAFAAASVRPGETTDVGEIRFKKD